MVHYIAAVAVVEPTVVVSIVVVAVAVAVVVAVHNFAVVQQPVAEVDPSYLDSAVVVDHPLAHLGHHYGHLTFALRR